MSAERFVALLAAEMRAPLARVELAASQLARESPTPSARNLAEGIREAVDDLDRVVARMLTVLLPTVPRPESATEIAPLIDALRARLAPVLEARGVTWKDGRASDLSTQVDPSLARAAALALLRAGVERVGAGGQVSLSIEIRPGSCGLSLECHSGRQAAFALEDPSLGALQGLVLSRGGFLEVREPRGVVAWLPASEVACDAS